MAVGISLQTHTFVKHSRLIFLSIDFGGRCVKIFIVSDTLRSANTGEASVVASGLQGPEEKNSTALQAGRRYGTKNANLTCRSERTHIRVGIMISTHIEDEICLLRVFKPLRQYPFLKALSSSQTEDLTRSP